MKTASSPKHVQRALLVIAATAFFGLPVVRAAWFDSSAPPGSPVTLDPSLQLPLNTTAAPQRKAGALTVNKTLTVNSDVSIGAVGATSQICWNNDCRSKWAEIGSRDFVHIYPDLPGQAVPNSPPPDTGYAGLTGTSDTTLKATSASPNGSRVYSGVAGYASSSAAGFSAGVYGDATASSSGYGVLGEVISGFDQAYAAYFRGKVALFDTSDLVIGSITSSNVQSARQNAVSEVCLNNECQSTWEATGTSFWSTNGSTLWPSSSSRNVSLGGGAFTIAVQPDVTTDVNVNGNATLSQLVIGDVTSTLFATSCGDGICNGSENDTFGSANYCPRDCDRTPPVNDVAGVVSWDSSLRKLTLTWLPPSNPDYAGTRVVVTFGNPPSGPLAGGMDVQDISQPGTSYTSPGLFMDGRYYFVLYAYDRGGNYASGLILSCDITSFNAVCST